MSDEENKNQENAEFEYVPIEEPPPHELLICLAIASEPPVLDLKVIEVV